MVQGKFGALDLEAMSRFLGDRRIEGNAVAQVVCTTAYRSRRGFQKMLEYEKGPPIPRFQVEGPGVVLHRGVVQEGTENGEREELPLISAKLKIDK